MPCLYPDFFLIVNIKCLVILLSLLTGLLNGLGPFLALIFQEITLVTQVLMNIVTVMKKTVVSKDLLV
jgi:hypothetical protein